MSDIFVDRKVYPTLENCQYPDTYALPLRQAIAYWQGLLQVMTPEEADSAVVRNWNQLEIWKKYRRTETDIAAAQKRELLQGLYEALQDGSITEDELQAAITRSAAA